MYYVCFRKLNFPPNARLRISPITTNYTTVTSENPNKGRKPLAIAHKSSTGLVNEMAGRPGPTQTPTTEYSAFPDNGPPASPPSYPAAIGSSNSEGGEV